MSVELKGMDAEIFLKNLDKEITEEEIRAVRAWALPDKMEIRPTKEQMKAIKSLERAFAKCRKAKVYFHNHYGTLMVYDGNIVELVNDTKTKTSCEEGYCLQIDEDLAGWADDRHYIHFKKGGNLKLG